MIQTACGLDCPDACRILADPLTYPKLTADTNNGALCSLLNREFFQTSRIERSRIDGIEVSMSEALDAVAQSLQKKSLLWRGSGNFGVMQEVTNLLFEKIGGTLTRGSLCDGAGDAGIMAGRGVNRILPWEQIAKAEVVIFWGRNASVTNSHIMPLLEGKKIAVIDPIATKLAKRADLHLQLKPRSDYYLAILLARFTFMENAQDDEWLKEYAPDFEDFYDFTRGYRIKAILGYMGLELSDLGELLHLLHHEKIVILVGNGVQKYTIGHSVLHAIDSLAATLGLFGKEGCGVGFLGNSKLGFANPFETKCSRVSKALTPFDAFETVLVQGGNPLESMPDSNGVLERLRSVGNLIYFGLYENATSKEAKIVIPAKNFFEKEDLRLSYGHHTVSMMNRVVHSEIGIGEYDFCKAIYERMGFEGLKSEQEYLDIWLNQCEEGDKEGVYRSPAYQSNPYSDGFGEDGGEEFVFVEEFDDDFEKLKHLTKYRKLSDKKRELEDFWLISPKANHSLNTQFRRDDRVFVHPDLGFAEGASVLVSSKYGSCQLRVANSGDLRPDCLLIPANTLGVNRLTPAMESQEGENACYQEVKVRVEAL